MEFCVIVFHLWFVLVFLFYHSFHLLTRTLVSLQKKSIYLFWVLFVNLWIFSIHLFWVLFVDLWIFTNLVKIHQTLIIAPYIIPYRITPDVEDRLRLTFLQLNIHEHNKVLSWANVVLNVQCKASLLFWNELYYVPIQNENGPNIYWKEIHIKWVNVNVTYIKSHILSRSCSI